MGYSLTAKEGILEGENEAESRFRSTDWSSRMFIHHGIGDAERGRSLKKMWGRIIVSEE
jgi:hypothetical protein